MVQFATIQPLVASAIESEAATNGQVLTANGSGGATWEDAVAGGGVTEITYADLVTAIGASGLTPGGWYKITDFATTHYMVDGNGNLIPDGEGYATNTGSTEPLLVLATSTNTLSPQAYSENHPEDIIYYDWDENNWLYDQSFAGDGGPGTIISGWTGCITFRHDTLYDNYAGYDWRAVKFRRWATDEDAWDEEAAYVASDFVNYSSGIYKALFNITGLTAQVDTLTLTGTSGTANVVAAGGLTKLATFNSDLPTTASDFVTAWAADYLAQGIIITADGADIVFTAETAGTAFTSPAITNASGDLDGTIVNTTPNHSANSDPSSDTTWIQVLDLSGNAYWNAASDSWLGVTSDSEDYADFTTFKYDDPFSDYIRSNHIEPMRDDTSYWNYSATILSNNVLSGAYCCSNTFGAYCYYNTFGAYCYYNTFGAYCYSNTFGASCYENTFGTSCNSNTFGASCYYNTFGTSCYSNTFGAFCSSNTFGAFCDSNTFGTNCDSNTFGTNCDSNTFGTNCSYNTFEAACYYSTFGASCRFNTFGAVCYANTFGAYCESNTFGAYCESNTFGDSAYNNDLAIGINNIDFSNATHVYAAYNCWIANDATLGQRLRYYDNDAVVFAAPDA